MESERSTKSMGGGTPAITVEHNNSSVCTYRSKTGNRCHMLTTDPDSPFCPHHFSQNLKQQRREHAARQAPARLHASVPYRRTRELLPRKPADPALLRPRRSQGRLGPRLHQPTSPQHLSRHRTRAQRRIGGHHQSRHRRSHRKSPSASRRRSPQHLRQPIRTKTANRVGADFTSVPATSNNSHEPVNPKMRKSPANETSVEAL